MYFWYILQKYLKSFFLVSFGLSFFYVLIDLVAKASKLPSSSNLQVLYVYYISLHSFFMFFSLSIVFGLLYMLFHMIKKNELVSFYSLGFSKKKLFFPVFLFVMVLFAGIIGINFTSIAYSQEKAEAILNKRSYSNKNLFLKWKDRVIYFGKINPILKKAYNIKIFYLKNNRVYRIVTTKEAVFKDNVWYSDNVRVDVINNQKFITYFKNLYFLKDFKPKILTNLNAKQVANISLYDAMLALYVLKGVSKNILLSVVFYKIFLPLSMISLMIILFFISPIHVRVSNISFFMIKSILITILIWGVYLLIYKFARQGVLSPYSLLVPFVLISAYAIYIIYKER